MPSLGSGSDGIEDVAAGFPQLAAALAHPLDRRRTLKLLAAALASGGLAGCDPGTPDRGFVSAVVAPEGVIPGVAEHYATAHVMDGHATGIVVTHQMGRPTKVEGNPLHPASLGATDVFSQAAVLDFYDPDRASGPLREAAPVSWQELRSAMLSLGARLAAAPGGRGEGLRILTGTVTSPSLGAAIEAMQRAYPGARWHQWDAIGRDQEREGAALAYGAPVSVLHAPGRADVILALDSDLLASAPGHLAHARAFAARRNPARAAMNRLYAAEPTPSLTGLAADHRFILSHPEIDAIVGRLAAALLHGQAPSGGPDWLRPVLADLRAHPGGALIHLGPDHAPAAHAAVLAMNEALGGRDRVFAIHPRPEYRPRDGGDGVQALLDDMRAGRVRALLMLDVNPVYQLAGFAEALGRVPLSVALSPRPDETAVAAHWHVPLAHGFEDWSDARAFDGTATILQPQAMPLYGGVSPLTMLGAWTGEATRTPLQRVRETWRERLGRDEDWQQALATGVVPGTASARLDLPVRPPPSLPAAAPGLAETDELTLLLRPDPHLWDGRFANNAWLQELPRSLTKTVWDNPLLLAPRDARRLGLRNSDEVVLSLGARRVVMPVWIQPGQQAGCIVGHLGFGRSRAGETGNFVGTDLFALRDMQGAVRLQPTGRTRRVASTEHHNDVIDVTPRDVMRHGSLAQFQATPALLQGEPLEPEQALYRRTPGAPVAWGMSIDLNACIGCNACVVACQSENNIPVVGRDEVLRQREMHWLRIDRSYQGGADAPDVFFQPVLCMHCEQAPCETVCPVGATSHDDEGLNLMVYNRCIGTRFCSNNCPYKVRRFNYFAFAEEEARPPISRNPDVTVRARGVMEKCTFCVQRIAQARIMADRDGGAEEVVTACQAACPTNAFSFGDIHDPESEVSRRKHSPLNFVLLPEQATRPRVTYEARILNRNPAITT